MKKKKITILTFLLVLLSAGLYGYSEFNRTNKDLLNEAALISIDAPALVNAFEKDSAAFTRKYTDQIVDVSGVVRNIDAAENPAVIALAGEGLSTVQCSMDSAHAELYKDIKEGNRITIKGICSGGRSELLFGTDIILNRGVIEKNKN